MILRGINFGPVTTAAGANGFYGEGYPHHRIWKRFGMDFNNATLVTKTTTLNQRDGNMPLKNNIVPIERIPKCIVVKPIKGVVLNAVGLSGPGARWFLDEGKWEKLSKPFFISFMSVAKDLEDRLGELRDFCSLLLGYKETFRAPFGLHLNVSCPNVGLHGNQDETQFLEEVRRCFNIAMVLGIPIVVKINALVEPVTAAKMAEHPACDAICISNTIPWGQLPEWIDWQGLFGSLESPLKQLGGGGLSGKPLLPIVTNWVRNFREIDKLTPIEAGGGVFGPQGVQQLLSSGAQAVFLGSIAILCPWRVRKTIQAVYNWFDWDKE